MRSPLFLRSGYWFAIGAALLWGISGVLAKYLFQNGMSPFELLKLRIGTAAVGFLAVLILRSPHLLRIAGRDIPYFVCFGIVGLAGVQFFYLFAISKIHVAVAILLQYMAPSLIALYALIFTKEKLTFRTLTALGGALVGCYLVVGAYNIELLSLNAAGIIGGLLAAATFAFYSIFGEYGMRRYSPWTVLFYALGFGTLFLNIITPDLSLYFRSYGWKGWAVIAHIGILGTLVPFGLYLEAVKRIRSTKASITATLEPVIAGMVAFWFLHEEMAWIQVLGGVIILAAVIHLQLGKLENPPASDSDGREPLVGEGLTP